MDKLMVSGEDFAPVLTEILSSGGSVSLVVSGSSMRPFLKHGRDSVCLRSCTEKDLKCGQILLFKRRDQTMVLHRIRRVLPGGQLVMNGDAQAWCETIFAGQVMAVAAFVERKGRRIPCDCSLFRLWNLFWYPTRPIRPALIKVGHLLRCGGKRAEPASCEESKVCFTGEKEV